MHREEALLTTAAGEIDVNPHHLCTYLERYAFL